MEQIVKIQSKSSKLVLQVEGDSLESDAQIIQTQNQPEKESQQFILENFDGEFYTIKNMASNLFLDIQNKNKNPSALVVQTTFEESDSQLFKIINKPDGFIAIQNKHSKLFLDIKGSSKDHGTQLIQFGFHGRDNQLFKTCGINENIPQQQVMMTHQTTITCLHSGKVLDVATASKSKGGKLIQWGLHGRNNQQFILENIKDNLIAIRNVNGNMYLTISGKSKDLCAKITQAPFEMQDNLHQLFIFHPRGQNYYSIQNAGSQMYLDVNGYSMQGGAELIQYGYHGAPNQVFQVNGSPILKETELAPQKPITIQCRNSGLYFDIRGGSMQEGSDLIQYSHHGGENQQFVLEEQIGNLVAIKCVKSGMYLSIEKESKEVAAKVTQSPRDKNRKSQLFRLVPKGDGFYALQLMHSQLYLDVYGGSKDQCANLIQYGYHGGPNQLFKLDGSAIVSLTDQLIIGKYTTIECMHSKLVFDICGGFTNEGAKLIQYPLHNGKNQKFQFQKVGEYYQIKCQHSELYLSVMGGSKEGGAMIVQGKFNGQDRFLFKLIDIGSGVYAIQNKNSGLFLDVRGGSKANSTQIIQWEYHGGPNQIFHININ